MTGSGWQTHVAADAADLSWLGSKLGRNRRDFPAVADLHCDLRHTNVSEHCRLETPWRGQAAVDFTPSIFARSKPVTVIQARQAKARDGPNRLARRADSRFP
jgi:hypothetical protein